MSNYMDYEMDGSIDQSDCQDGIRRAKYEASKGLRTGFALAAVCAVLNILFGVAYIVYSGDLAKACEDAGTTVSTSLFEMAGWMTIAAAAMFVIAGLLVFKKKLFFAAIVLLAIASVLSVNVFITLIIGFVALYKVYSNKLAFEQ